MSTWFCSSSSRRGSVICEPRGHDSSLLFGIASGLRYMDRAGETAPGGTGITLLAIEGISR
jgi:hypothetical protein